MLKVAFVCTRNSCRSQMAEAFARHLCAGVFACCSAGTAISGSINPAAQRIMKEKFGIDMLSEGQHPKPFSEIGRADVLITMGCGVKCPYLPCARHEDWGLEDPEGKGEQEFSRTAEEIRARVLRLREELAEGPL